MLDQRLEPSFSCAALRLGDQRRSFECHRHLTSQAGDGLHGLLIDVPRGGDHQETTDLPVDHDSEQHRRSPDAGVQLFGWPVDPGSAGAQACAGGLVQRHTAGRDEPKHRSRPRRTLATDETADRTLYCCREPVQVRTEQLLRHQR